jgi:predicted RND superfamily exporter protein
LKGTLLTTLTTTIGFMSLSTSTLVPIKDFGILCALGTSLAWFYTIMCIFPMAMLSEKHLTKTHTLPSFAKFNYRPLSLFCIRNAKKVVLAFLSLALFFIYLSTKNQVNSNPFEYFNSDLQVYKDNQFFIKKYGGFSSFEMSIDSMKQDEVYSPLFLNKVHKLQTWIKKDLKASHVGSIVDYQRLLNKVFHNNKKNEFKVPATRKESAELLTYYQMNLLPGQDLNSSITIDNRKVRSSVFWNTQSSKEYILKINQLYNKAKEIGLNIKITGREYLFNRMNGHVVRSFFNSIFITIIGISIFLIYIFKSVKFGLISLCPNLFPILFVSAIMSLLGKNLDVGTVLVASVCFGIAVDDTIHFLLDVQKRLKKGEEMESAFTGTFTETGTALLSTTVILVCSFTVFLLADFVPNHNFGLLSALILTAALITDFLFLPALISLFSHKR